MDTGPEAQSVHAGREALGLRAAWGIAVVAVAAAQTFAVLAPDDRWPRLLVEAAALVDGQADALALLLVGVAASRVTTPGPLLRAGAVLLVLGTLLRTVWPQELLQACGLALFAVVPLRPVRPSLLLALAVVLVAVDYACLEHGDYGAGWGVVGQSREDAGTLVGELRRIAWNGWTPLLPWLAFPILGVAADRLLRGAGAWRALCVGLASATVAAGVAAASASLVRGVRQEWWEWWRAPTHLFDLGPLPPGPTFVVHAAAVAVTVFAACRALAGPGRLALAPLAAAGALPWTALTIGGPLAVWVARQVGGVSVEGCWAGAAVALVALAVAGAVARRFGLGGPVEWATGPLRA